MEERINLVKCQKIRNANLLRLNKNNNEFMFHLVSLSSSLFLAFFIASSIESCAAERKLDKGELPLFLEPVSNVTVAVGRDASLSCVVDNLGQHKVAWVHLDRQMIVAIHRLVVSRQQRFFVTHDSHKTWTLHVTQVTEKDRGYYMCQVNTTPMISQKGYLQVVVPPNIVDSASSGSNLMARERENVTLKCKGEGFPQPQIRWRREDGSAIITKNGKKVYEVEGEILRLESVSREHLGSYFCIASNGVPPSVSKRILFEVEFPPQMHVPNQLVGVPPGSEVQLECQIEASPRPVTYWSHNNVMINNSSRVMSQTISDKYKYSMFLIIKDIGDEDFGTYSCVAKNSFSETNGSIKLNKVDRPTLPPPTNRDRPYPDRRVNTDQSTAARRRVDDAKATDALEDRIQLLGDNAGSRSDGRVAYDENIYQDVNKRKQHDAERERSNRNLPIRPINEFENIPGTSSAFRTRKVCINQHRFLLSMAGLFIFIL